MSQWTDPYAVLSVARGSTSEQIKKAYRQALLRHHPDKRGLETQRTVYTVDDVNRAFRLLQSSGDENTTTTIDEVINFNEIVDLGDFEEIELENGAVKWSRDCRCGASGYSLSEQDLELNGENADEIAVQCAGCSLWILVQYAVE